MNDIPTRFRLMMNSYFTKLNFLVLKNMLIAKHCVFGATFCKKGAFLVPLFVKKGCFWCRFL
jgi:hypothetical protein